MRPSDPQRHNRRQQRRPRQETEQRSRPALRAPSFGGKNPSSGKIIYNLQADVIDTFQKAFQTPFQAALGLLSFVASCIGIIGFYGASSAGRGYYSGQASGLLSTFPMRVLAFIIISSAIGWMMSMFAIWITSKPSNLGRIFSHLVIVIGSIFLLGCIDWIFAPDKNKAQEIVLFAAVVGFSLSIFLAKTNYKETRETDPIIISQRAELLLSFAFCASSLTVFRQAFGI